MNGNVVLVMESQALVAVWRRAARPYGFNLICCDNLGSARNALANSRVVGILVNTETVSPTYIESLLKTRQTYRSLPMILIAPQAIPTVTEKQLNLDEIVLQPAAATSVLTKLDRILTQRQCARKTASEEKKKRTL